MLDLYEKYHLKKEYTSIGLFREIKKRFDPKRILYPGCYVHITPSLIFSDVVYVDSFRNTQKFYQSLQVKEFIKKNKEYQEKTNLKFHHQDYCKDILEDLGSFDVVISQYGGLVGMAVKKYLKKGGILVCNDSHGDASMASIDVDYELTGVYNRRSDERFNISTKNLEEYMIPKKKVDITKGLMERMGKGIPYTKSPSGYIFRKK